MSGELLSTRCAALHHMKIISSPLAAFTHARITLTLIYLSLNLNGEQRETLWRLNSTILNNTGIKESLEKEINTYLEMNDSNTRCSLGHV